jgi:acyl carrier protein
MPNRQEIVAAVATGLDEIAHATITNVTEDTRLFEDAHLDSTSVLELLVLIEDTTGLAVDPENLDMDDFRSVGTLATYLLSQQDQRTTRVR